MLAALLLRLLSSPPSTAACHNENKQFINVPVLAQAASRSSCYWLARIQLSVQNVYRERQTDDLGPGVGRQWYDRKIDDLVLETDKMFQMSSVEATSPTPAQTIRQLEIIRV